MIPVLARAAVAVGLAAMAVLPATPAVASDPAGVEPRWHDGACAGDDQAGVTVVVDFQDLGGGVNVRCTERAPTDGADALDAAGIAWQGVTRWGRGFVCRIAGKPADDPCIDTPPASAYWSYWVAPRGGRWCYANQGVLNRTPPPGSVEGWSFSLGRDGGQSPPPRSAPPALAPGRTMTPLPSGHCDPGGASVPTTPPTTATPTTRPAGSSGGGGGAVPRPGDPAPPDGGSGGGTGGADGGPAGPGDAPTTTADGSTTTVADATSTTTTTTTTTQPDAEDEDEGRDEDGAGLDAGRGDGGPDEETAAGPGNPTDLSADGASEDGFPVSTAIGGAAVVVLAGAGAVLARRRRGRADDPDPLDDILTG